MTKELLWQIYFHSKNFGDFVETLRKYLKDEENLEAELGDDPPPSPPPPPPDEP